MSKRTICIALSLCLLCVLFSGCNQQTKLGMGAMGSEVWEEAPALIYGVLESDPLEILPWNSGRMEFTSMYGTAETELGYYYVDALGKLYYADKSNLSNWLPVCNKPDCSHNLSATQCNAYVDSHTFVIKNSRIYFPKYSWGFSSLISKDDVGTDVLASIAPNGTDLRLEYAIHGFPPSAGGGGMSILTGNQWLYLFEALDKNGNLLPFLSITTEEDTKTIPVDNYNSDAFLSMSTYTYGDEAFTFPYLATYDYSLFRYIDGQLVETDFSGLDTLNSYLSGNTLRIFRPNDGYYDVDLTTREEVFLAPAQLENSGAKIALPNCIIESTLLSKEGPGEEGHRMSIFDGQTWQEVKLPEELVHTDKDISSVSGGYTICSDCILLFLLDQSDGYATNVYRIPLTDGELKAEFCAKIRSSPETED